MARKRGIGINYWITTGNEADVDVAESLEWMAAQPDILPVRQIGLELARHIAMASIEACRQDGCNVAAVVLACLNDAGTIGKTFEVVSGEQPVTEALALI